MNDPICLKIAICGGVDAGKSSIIGVLTHNTLDDGDGSARQLITKTKHELESGRTSVISYNYIKYSCREITLLDLAGHLNYLKTTMYGITGHFLDYAIVTIGINKGINPMTKEHMLILLWLNIPFIVVLTKEDLCPPSVYQDHKKQVRRILKIPLFQKRSVCIDTDEEYSSFFENCQNENYFNTNIPMLTTSSKTGKNINRIHDLFKILPVRHSHISKVNIPKTIKNICILSYIECVYQVHGVGIVITGTLDSDCSPITVGSDLFIGPFGNTMPHMIPVRIKGLHDNFRNSVKTINSGQSFCANIRFLKENLTKNQIRKGLILTSDPNMISKMSLRFTASVKVINLKTTVGEGYAPVIHYRTVRQAAKIIEVTILNKEKDVEDNNEKRQIIRGEQDAIVKFEFMIRPEFIEEDAPLFFRDGITKGIGKIISACE
jgi:GTPase